MRFDTGTTPLFTALGEGIVTALQPLAFVRENPSERGSYLRTIKQIAQMPTAREYLNEGIDFVGALPAALIYVGDADVVSSPTASGGLKWDVDISVNLVSGIAGRKNRLDPSADPNRGTNDDPGIRAMLQHAVELLDRRVVMPESEPILIKHIRYAPPHAHMAWSQLLCAAVITHKINENRDAEPIEGADVSYVEKDPETDTVKREHVLARL